MRAPLPVKQNTFGYHTSVTKADGLFEMTLEEIHDGIIHDETLKRDTEAARPMFSKVEEAKVKYGYKAPETKAAEKAYKKAKGKLPYFTPNAVFVRRLAERVEALSGLVVVECDHLKADQVEIVLKMVLSDSTVAEAFITTSGAGVKWLVKWSGVEVDGNESFQERVSLPAEVLWDRNIAVLGFPADADGLPVTVDHSGADITRPCFVTSDPNAYHNPDPATWTPSPLTDDDREHLCRKQEAITNAKRRKEEMQLELEDALVCIPEPVETVEAQKPALTTVPSSVAPDVGYLSKKWKWTEDEKKFLASTVKKLNCPDGTRHTARLNAGIMLARCFKGGMTRRKEDLLKVIGNEAVKLGHDPDDQRSIASGFAEGMKDAKYEPIAEWGKRKSSEESDLVVSTFMVYDKASRKSEVILPKLRRFLEEQGYAIYEKHGLARDEMVFVHVKDHIIKRVNETQIRRFLTDWIETNEPKNLDYWMYKVQGVNGGFFEELRAFDPKLHNDDRQTTWLYYRNGALKVTKDAMTLVPYVELDGNIWENAIQDRDFVEDMVPGEWLKFLAQIMGGGKSRLEALKTGIGYMLNRFKDRAVCRALVLTDEALESEEGGTGKGILFQGLGKLRNVQSMDFRTRDSTSQFVFQSVRASAQILHLEDVPKSFDFGTLFNVITGDFEIENKGESRITIPFAESPKLGISTNFNFKGNSSSHARRKVEYEFANHFSKAYTPCDEFGHNLFDDWDDIEWNRFDTVMALCCQSYLKEGVKDGVNVNAAAKAMVAEFGAAFTDFMEEWIEDIKVCKEQADCQVYQFGAFYSGYLEYTGDRKITKNDLSRKLRKWAKASGWIIEKARIHNEKGFTIRKQ